VKYGRKIKKVVKSKKAIKTSVIACSVLDILSYASVGPATLDYLPTD
jgi:hypothetical protein